MATNRTFFIAFGLVLGVSIASLVVGDQVFSGGAGIWELQRLEGTDALELAAQQNDLRTYTDYTPEKVWMIGGEEVESDELLLITPTNVKQSADTVFVLDSSAGHVAAFSSEGDLIRTFGEGRGEGPGELLQPMDFALFPDGSIHVCDDGARQVNIYNASGTFQKAYRPSYSPYRCTALDQEHIAIMHGFAEHLFGIYKTDGESVNNFGTFIEDQRRYAIALDGFIESDGQGGFVYASIHAGMIFRFDPNGNLLYQRETIDPAPFPDLAQSTSTDGALNVTFPNNHERKHAGLSINEDDIYLLSWIYTADGREQAIDVYSLDNGAYMHSIRLPERVSRIAASDNALYTIFQSTATLTKWNLAY